MNNELAILNSLGENKVREFRISFERVAIDDNILLSLKTAEALLKYMVQKKLIKRYIIWDDVASLDKVLRIEKL